MAIRTAQAEWNGTLKEGHGTMKLGSGAYEGAYSFASRFEEAPGTNPEELIGAAHAGCFTMFLSALLSDAGFTPKRLSTNAKVYLKAGPVIARIDLATEGEVPGIDESEFLKQAENAKKDCPVSKALAGVEINLTAKLIS
ncbi:MAG: OsmC family protein [Flexilinea sp.]